MRLRRVDKSRTEKRIEKNDITIVDIGLSFAVTRKKGGTKSPDSLSVTKSKVNRSTGRIKFCHLS